LKVMVTILHWLIEYKFFEYCIIFVGPLVALFLIYVYKRRDSLEHKLLSIRQTPQENHCCLPIDTWCRILSFCYDKETIERSVFDDRRYHLKINCYNDVLQLNTLRTISMLNLAYYHATKTFWASIEYLPYCMNTTVDVILRLRNIRFLTLTIDTYKYVIKNGYLSGLALVTGFKILSDGCIDEYPLCMTLRGIKELDISRTHINLDHSVAYLQQLKTLRCNGYASDVKTLATLTNLTSLQISGSVREELFLSLTNLKTLRMGNVMEPFEFDCLLYLTKLRELAIFCASFLERDTLRKFYYLRSLYLHNNSCVKDSDIISLTSLTSLSLYQCTRVNGSCFHILPSLTCLDLVCRNGQDSEWHTHFRQATNLRILYIRDTEINPLRLVTDRIHNPLNRVCDPANFTQLRQLTYLHLPEQNVLNKDNITQLTQLTKLIFFNNELMSTIKREEEEEEKCKFE
jgi:hypothetical protein